MKKPASQAGFLFARWSRGAAPPVRRFRAGQRQNRTSRMMIGSGIPISHNKAPLPKPMTHLPDFRADAFRSVRKRALRELGSVLVGGETQRLREALLSALGRGGLRFCSGMTTRC